MEKPVVPADLPNSQEVKKALEDWRHQKELLIGQGAQAKAAWETAQERLKAVEGEIQEISSEILSATEEQQLRQLESQRDRAEKLLRELTELMAKQKAVETSLATLEGLRGKCPACRQSIPDEVRNRETETLGGQLAELDDAIQGTKEELGEYSGMESASTRLEDHRKALTRQAKLMEEQAKLHGFQSPNATDFESKMTILGEKIGKAERLLRMYTRQKASGNGGVRTSWNGRSWRSESLCWIGW